MMPKDDDTRSQLVCDSQDTEGINFNNQAEQQGKVTNSLSSFNSEPSHHPAPRNDDLNTVKTNF
jgi:hypothetical protein